MIGSTLNKHFETTSGKGRGIYGAGPESIDYYEYLLKTAIIKKERGTKKLFANTMLSMIKHMIKPYERGYIVDSLSVGGSRIKKVYATSCRIASLLALANLNKIYVVDKDKDKEYARGIAKVCHSFCIHSTTGLLPDTIDIREHSKPDSSVFSSISSAPFEAFYYLYVYTHDPIYREWGWSLWKSIDKTCRKAYGYSTSVSIVNGETANTMNHQFISKTLKYLYLLFTEAPLDHSTTIFSAGGHTVHA